MKWHKPTDFPKDGKSVLAKVRGLKWTDYIIARYDRCWWRYFEVFSPNGEKVEGWCGCELEIIKWAEIEEE